MTQNRPPTAYPYYAVLYISTLRSRKSLEILFLSSVLCKHTVCVLFHCQKLAIEECMSFSSSSKSNHYTDTIHIWIWQSSVIFRVAPDIWTLLLGNVSIYSGQLGTVDLFRLTPNQEIIFLRLDNELFIDFQVECGWETNILSPQLPF